jgi:SAM-dependent methyltransferase
LKVFLVAAAFFLSYAGGPADEVPYWPTPIEVVDQMLAMAEVKAGDVVYDLGSGDGRLVIAAAREFGARAVGVEIDAPLVQTSREHARTSGVADRATFLWQDLFVTDLQPATVVAIYLRDDVNLKLRPKLLSELRPGSRLVSHDFGMGDWEPDRVQRVQGPTRLHTICFWVIPARVEGVWQVQQGAREARLTLTQRYQTLSGALATDGREQTLTDARLTGDRITFTAGGQIFSGRVNADRIEDGTVRGASTSWSARRVR